jgi:hypothetical protein
MIDIARRDHPAFPFPVADLRDPPIPDACLAGVVCWYPLIFLAPPDRTVASAELARVLHRCGHLVTAVKDGDGRHRRSGRSAGRGVEFDSSRLPARQTVDLGAGAGLDLVFHGSRPPEKSQACPQGYLILRKA